MSSWGIAGLTTLLREPGGDAQLDSPDGGWTDDSSDYQSDYEQQQQYEDSEGAWDSEDGGSLYSDEEQQQGSSDGGYDPSRYMATADGFRPDDSGSHDQLSPEPSLPRSPAGQAEHMLADLVAEMDEMPSDQWLAAAERVPTSAVLPLHMFAYLSALRWLDGVCASSRMSVHLYFACVCLPATAYLVGCARCASGDRSMHV